ncbi:PTS lactose/cellobiose transporter subunit IIA [Enterococcus cecorum]|nr:PTS lactose/cellobiose transporter subunit IIA [Enterococcus cecorum]CAI3409782.1 PTS lactose/cellobiose transporter subunit IIA [Enterococcus cecorum]
MAEEKTKEQRDQEQLMATMGLIINGGNAKSLAFEAIYAAKEGKFDEAQEKLKEADEALVEAHNSQTEMLAQEAAGHPVEVHLLTVHSQDHLMNAITFKDLASEVVAIHQELAEIKAKLAE